MEGRKEFCSTDSEVCKYASVETVEVVLGCGFHPFAIMYLLSLFSITSSFPFIRFLFGLHASYGLSVASYIYQPRIVTNHPLISPPSLITHRSVSNAHTRA